MPRKSDVWDPFEPERKPRRWGRWLVGLAVVGGAGAFGLYRLGLTAPTSPTLLPSATPFYAVITPGWAAMAGLPVLRQAYPDQVSWDGFKRFEVRCREELGIELTTDVLPWLGPEMAAATSRLPASPAEMSGTLLFKTRSTSRAEACLDKIRDFREKRGDVAKDGSYRGTDYDRYPNGACTAVVGGFVVWSMDEAALHAIIDRADGLAQDTLARNPAYRAIVGQLPANAVARAFIGGPTVADAARGYIPFGERHPQPRKSGAGAFRAMGAAMAAVKDGFALELVSSLDLTMLPDKAREKLADFGQAVDPKLMAAMPADTVAAGALHLPPEAPAFLSQALAERGRRIAPSGTVDLDRDLFAWLEGDVAAAVAAPGASAGDLPAEGLLVMRPADAERARAGIGRMRGALEQALGISGGGWAAKAVAPYAFEERAGGGVAWQVLKDRLRQRELGGYGFNGDTLYVAVGADALASVGEGEGLGGEPRFKKVAGSLPRKAGGTFYVDLARAHALAQTTMPWLDTGEVARAFDPLEAVAGSGGPGVDDQGFTHGRLVVTVEPSRAPRGGAE